MEKQKYDKCIPDDFWKMTLEDCYAKNYLDAYSILARGWKSPVRVTPEAQCR